MKYYESNLDLLAESAPSRGKESTFLENYKASRKAHKYAGSLLSRGETYSEILEPIINEFNKETGSDFQNFGHYAGEGIFKKGEINYRTFIQKRDEFNKAVQQSGIKTIPLITDDFLAKEAKPLVQDAYYQQQEVSARNRGLNVGGFVGSLVGEVTEIASDPLSSLLLFVGTTNDLSAGSILRNTLGGAFAEGAYAWGKQPKLKKWLNNNDIGYTSDDMWRDIGTATVGGAVFGGGINLAVGGGAKLFGKTKKAIIESDTWKNSIFNKKTDEADADFLIDKANEDIDFRKENPFTGETNKEKAVAEKEHIDRLNQTLKNLFNDDAVTDPKPLRESTSEPSVASTPEKITEETTAEDIVEFEIDELKTDAELFQFKQGGDKFGVTDRLKGVTKWEHAFSNIINVFEKTNGDRIVVDGHQRLGLAKRIREQNDGQNPRLFGKLYKESDGYTPEYVRAVSARKNLAEGTGSPLDASAIFKLDPDKFNELPSTSALVRQGRGLAMLGDEAHQMVLNEMIPQNYGALVGKYSNNPAQQVALINLLRKTEPGNEFQAESIIQQANTFGFTKDTQDTLFGAEEITESLYLQRAKVLDESLKLLRQDKKTFANLVRNQERIEREGNTLKKNINQLRERQDETAIQIIKKLANTTGAIGDQLTEQAKRFKEGTSLKESAGQFADSIRRDVESGNIRGTEIGGARNNLDAEKSINAEITKLEEFNEPTKGQGVTRQSEVLENGLKSETEPFEPKEAFQEDVKLREDLRTVIDQGATRDQIKQHPAVIKAIEDANKIPDTSTIDGFMSEEFQKNRQYKFNNETVQGYGNILDKLYDDAKIMAYRETNRSIPTNDPIAKDKTVTLITGTPASGKSTFANEVAIKKKSMIIDSDEAKKTLPEFANGVGSNAVHTESKLMSFSLIDRAVAQGENIVIPRVGHKLDDVKKILKEFKDKGYRTEVLHIDVSPAEAFKRMIQRFLDTGKLINIDYFESIDIKPKQVYNSIKTKFDGYAEINANGKIGEQKITEENNLFRLRQGRKESGNIQKESLGGLSETPTIQSQAIDKKDFVKKSEEFQIPTDLKLDPETNEAVPVFQTQKELLQEFKNDKKMLDRFRDCV